MSEELLIASPEPSDTEEATLNWYSSYTDPDIQIDDDLAICTKQSADKFLFCKYYNKPYWIIKYNGYKYRGTITVPEELGIITRCKHMKDYIMFDNVHHEITTAIDGDEFFAHIEDPFKRERVANLDLMKTKKRILKEKKKRRQKVLNKTIVYDAAECLWAFEFAMSKFLSQDLKRNIISYLTKK